MMPEEYVSENEVTVLREQLMESKNKWMGGLKLHLGSMKDKEQIILVANTRIMDITATTTFSKRRLSRNRGKTGGGKFKLQTILNACQEKTTQTGLYYIFFPFFNHIVTLSLNFNQTFIKKK